MILYHITHRDNALSLLSRGIRTEDTRGIPRVWLCDRQYFGRMISELRYRRGWLPRELVAIRVFGFHNGSVIHTKEPGLVWIDRDIPVSQLGLQCPVLDMR